jgi:hypothetical protein
MIADRQDTSRILRLLSGLLALVGTSSTLTQEMKKRITGAGHLPRGNHRNRTT